MLHEKGEPLAFGFEAFKALLRLKEYRSLVKNDGIKTFIEFD